MTQRPRKRFGQNFLHDEQIIERIIAAVSPSSGQHIVEIGPGRGAITRCMAAADVQLTLIELDRDLARDLAANAALAHCNLLQADALQVDFMALAGADTIRVVGNFPYNISTPLLFHLLHAAQRISDIHCMLQLEVVRRLEAVPGSKNYGRLSVMIQYHCQVTSLFKVSPEAFYPVPRVESAFVRLEPRPPLPRALDMQNFACVVATAFNQRRKTLANALKGVVDVTTLERANIDPRLRAERLSVAEFVAISDMIASRSP